MAAVPEPIYSLRAFNAILTEQERKFPFYAALIYPPTNGLNQKLSTYIAANRRTLDASTGDSWLVLTVEDYERGLQEYKPSEIYKIATLLGAKRADIPCFVFFVEATRREVKLFQIRELLPESSQVTDEHITELFAKITDVCVACSTRPREERLECLEREMEQTWHQRVSWQIRATAATKVVIASAVQAATLFEAFTKILAIIHK